MADAATQTNPATQTNAAPKGGVVAYLCLEGAINAGEFYKKALAAELVQMHPADEKGRTMHVHLYINGSSVMLSDPYPEHGCPFVPPAGFGLNLPVKDVDACLCGSYSSGGDCDPLSSGDTTVRFAVPAGDIEVVLGIERRLSLGLGLGMVAAR